MPLKGSYERAKEALLKNPTICARNRDLFSQFFKFQEYKLKRRNGLAILDDPCYRTLLAYISRLKSVNHWFENKPWKSLTKADIRRVYDDLEEGRIRTRTGTPVQDKASFYNKILRGKPFEMAGKAEIVREVLVYGTKANVRDVRFIIDDEFRGLVEVILQPDQRLLAWLCFDIGEGVSAILALRKRDCTRQVNPETKEVEYRINLRRETLKRSRRARSELTHYSETVALLDLVLKQKSDDEPLFKFGHRQASKMFQRAVTITEAGCRPAGQPVTLKDLRSSMACDLLRKGWTTDEVNARLGHKPSSRELDKYVNFLAIEGNRPKKKLHENQIATLLAQIDEFRQRERLLAQRQEGLQREVDELRQDALETKHRLHADVKILVEQLVRERFPRRAA